MTILFSVFTDAGIIFAADTQITRPGQRTQQQPPQIKVHRVPGLGVHPQGGLIGFHGLAEVGSRQTKMADWLSARIANLPATPSAHPFAQGIAQELNMAGTLTPEQAQVPTGFHVGAFETRGKVTVPAFYYVWNYERVDDGGYYVGHRAFRVEEHLLDRDLAGVAPEDVQAWLRFFPWSSGFPKWYRNGDVPFLGPITSYLMQSMAHILQQQRESRRSDYRLPRGLAEWINYTEVLVSTTIRLSGLLYAKGDPRIGGDVEPLELAWPDG